MNYLINRDNISLYFLITICLSFVFSVLLLEIIFASYFFYLVAKKKLFNLDINKKKSVIFFAILYVYLLLNFIHNIDNDPSALRTFFFFRFFFYLYLISFLQKEFGINYVRFLNYLVLFLIIVCLDALFQAIFSFNIFGFKNISSYGMSRISGFFHNEYILGSFLFSFSWTIFIFFLNKKKTDSIINIFILSIFICTIFFAGEKAATFKLLLLLCLTFIFLKTYRVLFIKSFVPTFIFIFLILILQNNFFFKKSQKRKYL